MKVYLLFVAFRLPAAFLLDLLFGDPAWIPHPVVRIGRLVSRLEVLFRAVFPATCRGERCAGLLLVLVTASYAFALPFVVIYGLCYLGLRFNHPALFYGALLLDLFWGWQCLAARSLRDEALRVYGALSRSLPEAREAVARIVGRDTARLDRVGVVRACVETVAESTTDGVVSPMVAYAAGGAPLALLYKAVNTMDSMIGYKNERYRFFGSAAARLDDAANLLGARLAALCMLFSAAVLRFAALFSRYAFRFRPLSAARVFLRDRYRHESPNSAQTESVAAGALGLRLGGDAWYGGVLERKPVLGDGTRAADAGDILHAVSLMYATCVAALLLVTVVKLFAMVRVYRIAVYFRWLPFF